MTLEEALNQCAPSTQGTQFAVTYPERSLIAARTRKGKLYLVRLAEEDSKGGSRPGGKHVPVERAGCYQWRPAVT